MSFVTAAPEALSGAAGTVSGIGDAMAARNAAAASTAGSAPAASDMVSAMTAAVFEQLVAALRSGSGAYALTEAANAAAAG